ncbi:hypothetical protein I3842_01G014300 [Carya illinoinensis]|uniref:Uncharacterized protein n=1 Tax=Carya illinoinensis TaxID=32201 RepID=A0A922K7J9_CARIL|nr:hypothetical protein I3842_01G014300 [Carya illinoinensis]
MREAIMKHFDCDESRSESEAEVGRIGHFSEAGRVPREYLSYLPLTAASNGNRLMNLKSAKKDLEGRPQSATDTSESLMSQLHESEKTIASLQTELETLKKSTQRIENQIKRHKLTNEDLDRQLTVARVELNEAQQKFSSLEVELDDKRNCCEELEATCLELQLQFESVAKKEARAVTPIRKKSNFGLIGRLQLLQRSWQSARRDPKPWKAVEGIGCTKGSRPF